jgi:hypothetical protein
MSYIVSKAQAKMTQVPCSHIAFANETDVELIECNNKREEFIKKAESFLDKAKSVCAPHHLEHIRLLYVRQLETLLEMMHFVDEYTTLTSGSLKGYDRMIKRDVSTETLNYREECLDEDMQLIRSVMNDFEKHLNKIDKHGSQALKLMHKVDKPCGFSG